jgi:1-aminocyclopropane-1-carboxylate deaminase/D-cysteine desulfhydrase-like pyridoxal-dependent ACC family enzyme
MISIYSPPAVEDWVTYVSPLKGDYVPSLYDNDNAVYQSLFRMQELALDYIYTKNSGRYLLEGRYYLERKLFLHFCGLETWK